MVKPSPDLTRENCRLRLIPGGIALAFLTLALALLSPAFGERSRDLEKEILLFVGLMMASGCIYLFLVLKVRDQAASKGLLVWILGLGFLFRLLMLPSTPILEDDYLRYLWDGGVVAAGHNPYLYSPQDILENEGGKIPDDLVQLADRSGRVARGVNHPWLKTIYPPVAQAAFALSHVIKPWSIMAWRFVLLAADGISVYLLWTLLRDLGLPVVRIVVYWWNPLVIKEAYNSCHMEVLLFPLVLGALSLIIRKRPLAASALTGLGVGVKLWPIILMPLLWSRIRDSWRMLVLAAAAFISLSAAMVAPFVAAGLDEGSGFKAYFGTWEMNDALYMVFLWAMKSVVGTLGGPIVDPHIATRVLMASILGAWVLILARRADMDSMSLSRKFLWVIAAVFLLSPTQFPWYALWFLPLLSIHPQRSLLLLTVLLPLYYLRFYFNAKGMVWAHDDGIVWLEFIPVWCMLLWEWRKEGRGRRLQGAV